MEVALNKSKKKIALSDDVFACNYNEALIHQVVTAYMSAARAGTKAQKTRAEVRGGGAKPFKQKGTGRARAGTIRSPLWRSGGITFAAKPRSYEQKVNRKMFRGAIRSMLSELIRQDRLVIVDELAVETPKTKNLLTQLKNFKLDKNILIVSSELSENLYLASRNLSRVEVLDTKTFISDPVSLIRAEQIIISQDAIKEIEELLK